jgi:hypothetical protein
MSFNVVFLGWNRPIPGRERAVTQLFQDFLQYLGGLQQAGSIDSFEPVLLSAHGGDLNGFVLIRGTSDQLSAMMASAEWQTIDARGASLIDGRGTVTGVTGDLLMQWMNLYTENLPD